MLGKTCEHGNLERKCEMLRSRAVLAECKLETAMAECARLLDALERVTRVGTGQLRCTDPYCRICSTWQIADTALAAQPNEVTDVQRES